MVLVSGVTNNIRHVLAAKWNFPRLYTAFVLTLELTIARTKFSMRSNSNYKCYHTTSTY